jgi:D-alanine-D-alanine ligase
MVKDLKNQKIGVLRGGPSLEREISLLSGEAVIKALKDRDYAVEDIIVPQKRDLDYLKNWTLDVLKKKKIDLCFIALHGWFGEDGKIQRILSEAGYLYAGSDQNSCRIAMDKILSKEIFEKESIATPKYLVLDALDSFDPEDIDFPAALKPSSQGSSIGVYKIKNKAEAEAAMAEVVKYDRRILVEDFIEGQELTVGIVDDSPLAVIEISYSDDIYSYGVKYRDGSSCYSIPANIDDSLRESAKELALRAHRAIGCNNFSRVDMIYSKKDHNIYILEVNTIPGLTKVSLLPKAAKFCGIEFDVLVLKMLQSAFKEERCSKD